MPPPHVPHVALLIETSRSYGRALLRGVRRYTAAHGPWSVFLEMRALDSKPPPWLKHWKGDGILTRTGDQAMADVIAGTGVPAVELRATKLNLDWPFLGADNRAIGRAVADHLLERGFRRFAVYDLDTEDYFEERRNTFLAAVRDAGHDCVMYRASGHREKPAEWEREQEKLTRWAAGLEKPVGVMACTDQLGFWLLDACKRAGVGVPEEVAVVATENDESLCAMATPPLSSVDLNGERIGYEAAALLGRLMAGEKPPAGQTLYPPRGIVTRQSSDVIAVEDEEVARAVRFIRERACDGITVADVVAAVSVSRSALERHMRAALGRSPKAEILRVKLARLRQLLSETNLPLDAVARRCGFAHARYVNQVFRKQFGQSPGAFRAGRG